MTLKLTQITSLPTLIQKIKTLPLPIKTSYKFALLGLDVERHVNFYREQLQSIIQNYGQKDEKGNLIPTEDGNGVLLASETYNEAYAKVAELEDLEVELKDISFKLEDFGTLELTPEEVAQLLPFIKEEE